MWSPGDFDNLDAPGSQFLTPQASRTGNGHASEQKKLRIETLEQWTKEREVIKGYDLVVGIGIAM